MEKVALKERAMLNFRFGGATFVPVNYQPVFEIQRRHVTLGVIPKKKRAIRLANQPRGRGFLFMG